MPDLDSILLNHGLTEIPFGSRPAEVRALLGEPDAAFENEDGDLRMEYPELGLDFEFWREEDGRLGTIGSQRPGATLEGHPLVGRSEDDLRILLEGALDAEITDEDEFVDEDGSEIRWLDVDELNIVVWLRDDAVARVDWFCDWSDDETPVWPTGG